MLRVAMIADNDLRGVCMFLFVGCIWRGDREDRSQEHLFVHFFHINVFDRKNMVYCAYIFFLLFAPGIEKISRISQLGTEMR